MSRKARDAGGKNAHVPRFYVDQRLTPGKIVELDSDQAHHLGKVLRAACEDPVTLFDGNGGEYGGRIASIDKSGASIRIEVYRQPERESPLKLTLAQGIARGDRMDFAIAKAVEMGVDAIDPVFTERGKVKLSGARLEKKQGHWRRVAISAAEQCGRERVPEISLATGLHDWLGKQTGGVRLLLDPQAAIGLQDIVRPDHAILLVGPESGLSEREIAAAEAAGFTGIRFGPRILRTETAGVAALAALQALWGDLA